MKPLEDLLVLGNLFGGFVNVNQNEGLAIVSKLAPNGVLAGAENEIALHGTVVFPERLGADLAKIFLNISGLIWPIFSLMSRR